MSSLAPPRSLRPVIASVVAMLLVIMGLVVPTQLAVAADSPTLSAGLVPSAGGAVTVTGSGFSSASPGLYLGVRAEGASSDTFTVWLDVANTDGDLPGLGRTAPMNADGSFQVDVTVPAATDGTSYVLFARKAHGIPDASQRVTQSLTYAPVPATPSLTVSQTSGLDPQGQTLTVIASGYDGSAVSRYGAGKAGFYIQVGWLAPTWRPSEGALSSARSNAASTWVADAANSFAPTKWTVAADGTVGAEWTVDVTQAALDAVKIEGGSLAVFTVGAGGVVQAAAERAVPITFAPDRRAAASVTSATADQGLAVHVDATGLGSVSGAYVALIEKGTEADVTASDGSAAMTWARGITGGVLSTDLIAPAAKLDPALDYEVIVWQQHTLPSAGTLYARADLTVTEAQWQQVFPGAPTPTPTPTDTPTPNPTSSPTPTPTPTPTTPAPETVAGGSLSWPISSSFTRYVTGPIAHGSVIVSGGATLSDGVYRFGQAAGSTFDGSMGTVSYVGSVRYVGHGGILDVTVANPQIRLTSATAGALVVTSGGREVVFATLELAGATRTEASGAVTYAGVAATLTDAGRTQVFGGNATTLDPLTFTVGAAAAAPAGATGTVATASSAVRTTRSIPATPPATTGIELDEATLAALQSGDRVTVTASGFQSGETGISIVVYSTPTLLDTVAADASGTATWTGTLPATLADGAHTLTFQGSVSRGIPFTLTRAVATALGTCQATAATLDWGVKESFRTYIEGIAAGGWQLEGVTYAYPVFSWATGTGAVDPEALVGTVMFGGSVRFTGHGGALDTTLANARIEFAGDVGYLVFDVTGTTQAGEAVAQHDVRFAQFALTPSVRDAAGITLTDAATTLTPAGAAAFGTYSAGEQLDPVSASIALPSGCAAAAQSSSGSGATEVTAAGAELTSDDTALVWPWFVGGGVLLAAAVLAAVLVVRRRRA
ncbi:MAG: HtaA domain-containing protein [Microbacterium ginsengisoli]|uniref:HtaA domain-containing protein n=3 Tax=Microbacteriaceae TaxID=85023 RepID=UPI0006F800FB|nr:MULTISPECIES: HtaA domain-containing protein [unclassified Microbacterium]KQR92191.1 hypothetical protein ASF93_06260 [Microbacterium sp. Leaf347]MBN9197817.1 HtaA domain-containing protein [Microbacterium ginsengisoli]OJU79278.1 MAG: hypothetical protein BGO15_10175 [Microbacterium sp. 71-23]